jgi:hypothetical protein
MRFPLAELRRVIWLLVTTTKIVNWCGHSQEYVPWPEPGGWWRLVPVWDSEDRPENLLERHTPPERPPALSPRGNDPS